jgi:hypothetical protein
MAKAKKRRKEEVEETDQTGNSGNTETTSDKKPKKKSKKSELDDEMKPKKEKSKKKSSTAKRPSTSKLTNLNNVHVDSLQSIFATKDSTEGTFTLFGGDLIMDDIPETAPPPSVFVLPLQPAASQPGERKIVYFFPHFESPERNALSLFPVSDEPFFHERTEYAIFYKRR